MIDRTNARAILPVTRINPKLAYLRGRVVQGDVLVTRGTAA